MTLIQTMIKESELNMPPVMCIGITGGIGSGKSYVCHQLEEAGHHIFYCDDEAKKIIRTNPVVMDELRALVGPEVYDAEGRLVKSVLAAYLCRGREYSARVDAIVHPRVAEAFRLRAEQMRREADSCPAEQQASFSLPRDLEVGDLASLPSARTLFMECALLFESGFNRLVDHTVLVHVSSETQISRLMARDRISREKALAWIALQWSEEEKLKHSDSVIVNE